MFWSHQNASKKKLPIRPPEVLKRLTLLLWQIAGPLSWLVSIVVTFVLIPAAYANEPAKVEPWFSWRKFQRWFYKRRFFATGWLLFGNSGYMSNASFSVYQHTNRSLKRFTTAKFFRSLWKSSAPSKMIFDCVAQCFMSHSHVSSNHPSSTVQQDMVVRPVLSKDVMLGWRPQVLHNGDLDKSESIFHWEPSCCFCFSVRRILLFFICIFIEKSMMPSQPTQTKPCEHSSISTLISIRICLVLCPGIGDISTTYGFSALSLDDPLWSLLHHLCLGSLHAFRTGKCIFSHDSYSWQGVSTRPLASHHISTHDLILSADSSFWLHFE